MASVKTWKCEVCGYIHKGDSPPDICPVCGALKELFVPFEVVEEQKQAPAASWSCTVCGYVHEGEAPPDACPVCGATKDLFQPHEQVPVSAVQSQVKDIVIIGGGIAGFTAAEQARSLNPKVNITVISKEPVLPYYRLNLTRYIAGEVSENDLIMQGQNWYDNNKIRVLFDEVQVINKDDKKVQLNDGTELSCDALILANGSHAFIPPFPGVTLQGVQVLRSVKDAKNIIRKYKKGMKCVCIGGGLLGLEAAGALQKRGAQVSIIEGYGWLLPRQLPEKAGLMLKSYIESLDITVYSGIKIKEITGDEDVKGIVLDNGAQIPADLVIISAGVRPNSCLARQAELDVHSGIIVDDRMATSNEFIYACGDVAEHNGIVYGIWPASYLQGSVAGTNAVGGKALFKGIPPSNRLKVLNVDLFSIGNIKPADSSYAVYEKEGKDEYMFIVCRDGKIVGAVLYGNTELAHHIQDAIEHETQIPQLQEIIKKMPIMAQK